MHAAVVLPQPQERLLGDVAGRLQITQPPGRIGVQPIPLRDDQLAVVGFAGTVEQLLDLLVPQAREEARLAERRLAAGGSRLAAEPFEVLARLGRVRENP